MEVNFDGLRKNATISMNDFYAELEYLIENSQLQDTEVEDLKEKWNYASSIVGTFNCLFDPTDDGFSDLSHLNIKQFENNA